MAAFDGNGKEDTSKRRKQLDEQEAQIVSPDHGNTSPNSNLPMKRPAPQAMDIDSLLKPVKRAEDR